MTSRYCVNASILLTDRPLLERPAAVRAAGFDAVEFWWPFPEAVPPERDVAAFVASVVDAGLQLNGLNLFAGDMAAGDRGIVSDPARRREFGDHLEVITDIVTQTGCRGCNALYGRQTPESDDDLAVEQLVLAGSRLAEAGATVLVEPLSGVPDYPVQTAADALALIERVQRAGGDNVALLADLYHLAVNGDDVDTLIARHARSFGHVQIADAPGRGRPGSGELPLRRWVGDCVSAGYDGWIGLEYACDDPDPFAWLRPAERRFQEER